LPSVAKRQDAGDGDDGWGSRLSGPRHRTPDLPDAIVGMVEDADAEAAVR